MSELTNDIRITFENIMKVYQASSSLLLDTDSLMEEKGYTCVHGNYLGTEQSKNINLPNNWIPPFCSRHYVNIQDPEKIKTIGIFYVDKAKIPIDPLIITAIFQMDKDKDAKVLPYYYGYLKEAWFSLAEEKKLDSVIDISGGWNFIKGKVRAVSLDVVDDQASLKTKVIQPLLNMRFSAI